MACYAGTNTFALRLMFIDAKGFAESAWVAALTVGVSMCGAAGIGIEVLICNPVPDGTNSYTFRSMAPPV